MRIAVGVIGGEADVPQHVGDAILDLARVGHAVQAQRIGERAAHGLARIERGVGVLEHHLHGAREAAAIDRCVGADRPCRRP